MEKYDKLGHDDQAMSSQVISVSRRMRRDWNRRARSDVQFYVALGRRSQSWEDFLAGAEEVVVGLEKELGRLSPAAGSNGRRALEIGCGPGRLMLPMSRHFSEIHGVDVSTEMARLAERNLAGVPHTYVHVSDGTNLAQFDGEYFDFVYSYAVFQHIPSSEIVLNCVKETRRVLKTGGVARLQFNGMRKTIGKYDTWAGVRLEAGEIAAFARESGLQLLALEGVGRRDMWATFVKPSARRQQTICEIATQSVHIAIREITAAGSSLPEVPARGRFASAALWLDGLPPSADLNTLQVFVSGRKATLTRIDPMPVNGLQRVTVSLPAGLSVGRHPVRLTWLGTPVEREGVVRVVPPGAENPKIVSVSDGIFLGCGRTVSSKILKVSLENSNRPEDLRVTVGGQPTRYLSSWCPAPDIPRFEVSFRLSAACARGTNNLECWLGPSFLGCFEIFVTRDRLWWWRMCHPAELYQGFRRSRWTRKEKLLAKSYEAS